MRAVRTHEDNYRQDQKTWTTIRWTPIQNAIAQTYPRDL